MQTVTHKIFGIGEVIAKEVKGNATITNLIRTNFGLGYFLSSIKQQRG